MPFFQNGHPVFSLPLLVYRYAFDFLCHHMTVSNSNSNITNKLLFFLQDIFKTFQRGRKLLFFIFQKSSIYDFNLIHSTPNYYQITEIISYHLNIHHLYIIQNLSKYIDGNYLKIKQM